MELDYQRNAERYAFLRSGQRAFHNFRVVPPNTGIVHQVNLEYLSRVVFTSDESGAAAQGGLPQAYPDTCVGTDSHTPMVNGLGILAWGVGGIEAEAAMLGQPISMLIPQVIGFRLESALAEGATATDLVLTVTEMLRKKGFVGKFVELFGPGCQPGAGRPRHHRQHVAGIRRHLRDLEIMPLAGLFLLAVLYAERAAATGADAAWTLRLKETPLPLGYLVAVGAGAMVVNVLPLAEESWRCLRCRAAGAGAVPAGARAGG